MSIDGFIVAKNFETAGIHKYLQALVLMKEIGYNSKNGNVEDENREKDSQEIADVEFDDIYPVFLST
jgi:hypothetical protein